MPRRIPNFLVAFWWFTWVFVIVPCHTRGVIPLGGCPECDSHDNTPFFFGSVDASCPMCAAKNRDASHKTVPHKSSGNCAICNLVATTPNPAPPPILVLNLQFVEILSPVTPCGTVHFFPIRAYQSRAPPLM